MCEFEGWAKARSKGRKFLDQYLANLVFQSGALWGTDVPKLVAAQGKCFLLYID
jgi:hypothetical protein